MKRKTVLIWINLAVALVLAGTLLAQAQESLFGTWKMNAAKSKYSPGPVPKSNIAKWEPFQGGVKLTVDVVPAKGATIVFWSPMIAPVGEIARQSLSRLLGVDNAAVNKDRHGASGRLDSSLRKEHTEGGNDAVTNAAGISFRGGRRSCDGCRPRRH